MSFIAPQAYTKETLGKAFDWLQHQPQNLKEVATSPDILVNMYLRAQRQGIDKIDADAPNSARRFIEDLNSLKKDIAQFDDPSAKTATAVTLPPIPSTPSYGIASPMPPKNSGMNKSHVSTNFASSVTQKTTINTSLSTTDSTSTPNLDDISLKLVQEVQEKFNLSSPQEALRMMIVTAHKHISKWE